MVGGYQLISLKDYVFDLSEELTSRIIVRREDTNIFKNLLNINKPIICKDIIVRISEYSIEKFDNILFLKYDYIHKPPNESEKISHRFIGLLYDCGDTFGNKQAQLLIMFDGENIVLSLSKEEDI